MNWHALPLLLTCFVLVAGCQSGATDATVEKAPSKSSPSDQLVESRRVTTDEEQVGKIAGTKAGLKTLTGCLDLFRLDCDRYPTTEEGLNALLIAPTDLSTKWKGPYLGEEKQIPKDSWGNPFHYTSPGGNGGDSYVLVSYGADGKPGGTDNNADIASDQF